MVFLYNLFIEINVFFCKYAEIIFGKKNFMYYLCIIKDDSSLRNTKDI